MELGRIRHRRVPAANRVLIDQIEQHDPVLAHHTRRRVTVAGALLQELELMETVFDPCFIAQDARRHAEFPMRRQRAEVQRSEAVGLEGAQRHSENALLTPLEVQTGNVVITAQRIRIEEAVRKSPGLVLLVRVRNQTVAQLIGEVRIRVVARFTNVDNRVGNERVRIGVLRAEGVATQTSIGAQIEHIDGVRTDLLGGVSDADGSGVEHPQPTAFVRFDTINGVQTVLAVTDRIRAPIRIWNEFGRTGYGDIGVDVGKSGRNTCNNDDDILES